MSDSGDDTTKGNGVDRRQFGKILVAAGVGGLALANANPSNAQETATAAPGAQVTDTRDVVIVGAGLSGLIAARELKRAGKNVLVLEAKDRIGGRMFGRALAGGGYVDYGGQWVGKTQYDMKALVAELKITPFLSYEEGRSIQSFNDNRTGFNGDVSQLLEGQCGTDFHFPHDVKCANPDPTLPNCSWDKKEHDVWQALLDISKVVPPDRPWDTPGAKDLDKKTFKQFLSEQGVKDGEYANWLPTMQARIGGSGGFEPDKVSLLHMAWTQRVGPQAETPETWLLCGGAGQIPAILAEEIGKDRILLNTPVDRIEHLAPGGVVVYTPTVYMDGRSRTLTIRAKAVIVAIPPPMRKNIKFPDNVSPQYAGYIAGAPMGSMSKVHAVYKTAFWRPKCLSGSAAANLETCEFIADSSDPTGNPGILTSFIAAQRNTDLIKQGEAKVREAVLRDYVKIFGSDAANPQEFVWANWNEEPWIRGAFTSYCSPNTWTQSGPYGWREPIGDIYWAGTETSDRWPGYFDGAIHAGKAAALRVLAAWYGYQEPTSCAKPG